jgi:EAL domain-containing protein (putative c-di-GMP-specific phosphodiesterase class I)
MGAVATLNDANALGWPASKIIFELTERLAWKDTAEFRKSVDTIIDRGAKWALDDFGVGATRLPLLMRYSPDFVKLDRNVWFPLHKHKNWFIIMSRLVETLADLNIAVIGEGVETRNESRTLLDVGISCQQGYYLSRPQLQQNL